MKNEEFTAFCRTESHFSCHVERSEAQSKHLLCAGTTQCLNECHADGREKCSAGGRFFTSFRMTEKNVQNDKMYRSE